MNISLAVAEHMKLTARNQKGTGESVLDELRELLPLADQGVVRPVAGTILQLEGETAEAINLLADAGEDLESSAFEFPCCSIAHTLELTYACPLHFHFIF